MAEVTYAPGAFVNIDGEPWEAETMLDLAPFHPGLVPLPTVTGGWSVVQRATMRWKGTLALGPYRLAEHAEAVEAMLSQLSSGVHWCMFPLHRSVWTGADLYVTAAPDGTLEGTALTLNGQRADMRVGQMFTVGDPDDADTVHPRRVRQITGVDRGAGGFTTIQQNPPLPQSELGAANAAALVQPATHIPARLTNPGSVSLPLSAGAPGRYGPWVVEWTEFVFTGGG